MYVEDMMEHPDNGYALKGLAPGAVSLNEGACSGADVRGGQMEHPDHGYALKGLAPVAVSLNEGACSGADVRGGHDGALGQRLRAQGSRARGCIFIIRVPVPAQMYVEDMMEHPDNGYALKGLAPGAVSLNEGACSGADVRGGHDGAPGQRLRAQGPRARGCIFIIRVPVPAQMYVEDMMEHPDNGYALKGLALALQALNRTADAAQIQVKHCKATTVVTAKVIRFERNIFNLILMVVLAITDAFFSSSHHGHAAQRLACSWSRALDPAQLETLSTLSTACRSAEAQPT